MGKFDFVSAEQMVDNSPQHVYVYNVEGKFLYANIAGARACGLHPDDFIGKSWRELGFAETVIETFDQNLRKVFNSGKPIMDETIFFTIDGPRYYEYILQPVFSSEGAMTAVVSYSRDITVRKEKEEIINQFFNLSLDVFMILDFEGNVVESNGILSRLLRVEEKRVSNIKDFADLLHPNDFEKTKDAYHFLLAGIPSTNFENRYRTSTGEYLWFSWNSMPNKSKKLLYLVGRNITDTKKVRGELAQSHERLDRILNSINEGFYILDREWKFTYVNKETEQIWAMPKAKLLEKRLWEVYPDACNEKSYSEYVKAYQKNEVVRFDEQNRHSGRWSEITAYPSKEGLTVFFRDITERVRNEQKIRRNEACLQALLKISRMSKEKIEHIGTNVLKDALRLTGSEIGYIGFVNDAESAMQTFSWSIDAKTCAIPSKTRFHSIETGGIWTEVIRERRALIINDYKAYCTQKALPEGHENLKKVLSVPIFEEDKIVMLVVVANKTGEYDGCDIDFLNVLVGGMWEVLKRKKAEKELRLSEERFSKAFAMSPSVMSIRELDSGRYVDVNRTFERVTGFSRTEVVGLRPEELGIWEEHSEIQAFMRGETLAKNRECNFFVKSGIFTGLVSTEIITINGKKHILTVTNDISEIKRFQQEFSRLDRLNLIGQLASGIGHEVRNPMQTVRGFLQLMQRKKEYSRDEPYFELMITELDRANSIITEFLSLSKKQSDNLLEKDLNKILDKLSPLLLAQALNENKEIEMKLGQVPTILADEKEITQLLLNLVKNGFDAMEERKKLFLRTYVDVDGLVVLEVKDQGRGIARELQDKLGTPFVTNKDNGTGLGLAVSYSIADRHRAKINFETGSEGTTFYVKFPPRV
ncbi:PAS domain S-box protein [Heliobacterium chlorum]|uniref:histidine kinase n=1 Tax=Heliobacterium chlorum TaxID=2698 RepID=A0ABR7SZP0_HELCL|nr:PAS domain S-box protein [Heliobacterium chlorum]MBC9783160.1 PAS domain S-box protein [Heliobacterium chlorum]